jgi:hypothetical protein
VSKIWLGMRAETTSYPFPRAETWKPLTRTCAPIVSAISSTSWLGGPIPLLRASRLSARIWDRCQPIRPNSIRWWKCWCIRPDGCASRPTTTPCRPQYAHQRLTLQADPFHVCLFACEALVANHPRCCQKRQVIEDLRHYVPLLLKKSFAVPGASALRHGDLPATFETARLEPVAQRSDGNREFARLLELCLTHEVSAVEAAYKFMPPSLPPPRICLAASAAIPAIAIFAPVPPSGPPGPMI